jgi:hypothetical protein
LGQVVKREIVLARVCSQQLENKQKTKYNIKNAGFSSNGAFKTVYSQNVNTQAILRRV